VDFSIKPKFLVHKQQRLGPLNLHKKSVLIFNVFPLNCFLFFI